MLKYDKEIETIYNKGFDNLQSLENSMKPLKKFRKKKK